MCPVAKGAKHEPAPIPEEEMEFILRKLRTFQDFTHGVELVCHSRCLASSHSNVKNGVIEEALVETIGCSRMTHSAAMAAEILQGKTILEALNTDLVL